MSAHAWHLLSVAAIVFAVLCVFGVALVVLASLAGNRYSARRVLEWRREERIHGEMLNRMYSGDGPDVE